MNRSKARLKIYIIKKFFLFKKVVILVRIAAFFCSTKFFLIRLIYTNKDVKLPKITSKKIIFFFPLKHRYYTKNRERGPPFQFELKNSDWRRNDERQSSQKKKG